MRLGPVTLSLLAAGCAPAPEEWTWNLPPQLPAVPVPADNPMSRAKVELGRRLFHDVRLSRNRQQSCGTCHLQRLAFTDGRALAVGSTGETHPRNAQGLANVAYAASLTWANPLLGSLEAQALVPLLGEHPVELGWAGAEDELLARLAADGEYAARFADAFPELRGEVSLRTITRALAAFQRTLLSFDAPYDRWTRGDPSALSAAARRGLELFNSERLECYHCHAGFNFSDSVSHPGSGPVEQPFHNTGLHDEDGNGAYPANNQGLKEITGRAGDMGRFRAPSLRNVTVTGPYMHDGSIATLREVLASYEAGGEHRRRTGQPSPLQSDLVRGFSLTQAERDDVLAFLESLTDSTFLEDPAFGPPP